MSELERLLAQYGQGYQPDLGGDDLVTSTRDVMSTMDTQHATREHEYNDALVRLLTTFLPAAGAAHRAISASNLPRAIGYHNRLEQKQGNNYVNAWTKPVLSPILAAMAPSMARAMNREDLGLLDSQLASRAGRMLDKSEKASDLFGPHIDDTARILNTLNDRASRGPQYTTFYAEPKTVPLAGAVVNAVEQSSKPTARSTALSPRQAAIEEAQRGLKNPAPPYSEMQWLTPLGTSQGAGAKHWADQALRSARGDYDQALSALKDNPEAANVLRYWRNEAGYSFRPYKDAERAQNYWEGLAQFQNAERPNRMNSVTGLPLPAQEQQPLTLEEMLQRYAMP